MRYRELGKTGFQVSEVSLGTVEIGMPYGIAENGKVPTSDEVEAIRLLNYALDRGINFIDTARAYGESEAIIGRALHGRRREFILASKVLSRGGQDLTPEQMRDLTIASVHESLRLLQTDSIDLMMVHCGATEILPDETIFETLTQLRNQGCIRAIGASVYGEEAALAAINHGGYECLQIAYNLLDRRPEAAVLAVAREKGVGLVARSVLLKGALTDRYHHLPNQLSELTNAVQELEQLARRISVALPELAYRYVISQAWPQTALVGTASLNELQQILDFVSGGPLLEEQIAEIRTIPMLDSYYLNPGNWPSN
jgi:aryl-alcohol dehydrogenase-like predicted oxidoreductase